MLARARSPCEKLSQKSVAAPSWRANNVRPYILHKAKQMFFDILRRGQDPSLRMEDSMAADAKRAGRACPAPTGRLKKAGMGANIAMMLLN